MFFVDFRQKTPILGWLTGIKIPPILNDFALDFKNCSNFTYSYKSNSCFTEIFYFIYTAAVHLGNRKVTNTLTDTWFDTFTLTETKLQKGRIIIIKNTFKVKLLLQLNYKWYKYLTLHNPYAFNIPNLRSTIMVEEDGF